MIAEDAKMMDASTGDSTKDKGQKRNSRRTGDAKEGRGGEKMTVAQKFQLHQQENPLYIHTAENNLYKINCTETKRTLSSTTRERSTTHGTGHHQHKIIETTWLPTAAKQKLENTIRVAPGRVVPINPNEVAASDGHFGHVSSDFILLLWGES